MSHVVGMDESHEHTETCLFLADVLQFTKLLILYLLTLIAPWLTVHVMNGEEANFLNLIVGELQLSHDAFYHVIAPQLMFQEVNLTFICNLATANLANVM